MPVLLLRGLELLELDSYLKVLCLCSPNILKGLQWVLERKALSENRYQLFQGSLAQLDGLNLADFDLVFLNIDLGQPVPLEHLRKVQGIPGVCAFQQPTPQQLLQLLELPSWTGLAWDGVSFDRIVERLEAQSALYRENLKTRNFIEGSRSWLKRQETAPAIVEWTNPPSGYAGALNFILDPKRRFLSVGAASSRADLKLPFPGVEEFVEFRYQGDVWMAHAQSSQVAVQYTGQAKAVRGGDYFEIGEFIFQVRIAPKVEEFLSLARRVGVFSDNPMATTKGDGDRSVADLCKEILYSGAVGELKLSSGLKNGSIFFADGHIENAVSGAVSGLKALLRILGWSQSSWRFNLDQRMASGLKTLQLSLPEFARLHQQWFKSWSQVANMIPPANLKLRANIQGFTSRSDWSIRECQVIASICEFRMIRDILNNCPLHDVEIVETLIQMRRQGLIEPETSQATAPVFN